MISLSPHQYPLASPCLESLHYHLAVPGIIAGKLPASVFVDDPAHPQLALAWAKKRVYLAGGVPRPSSLSEIRSILIDRILPQAEAAHHPMLALNYAPDSWGAALQEILSDRRPEEGMRQHYTFSALPGGWQRWIPEGFRLQAIDANFLGQSHLTNMDGLIDEIQSEGEPLERFLSDRFGICALSGSEIAGWCLSEYNLGDSCEIGIETLEPFQRRGLGSAMTCALVEEALSRGVTQIGWDCYRDNLPSVATARRAGFTLDTEYPTLVCWFY